MKYFQQGGFLYGLVYTIWRGLLSLHWVFPTWFYRQVLGQCGAGSMFSGGVYVALPRQVRVGAKANVGRGVILNSETTDGKLMIGDRVQLSTDVVIDYSGSVSIGDDALISAGVHIMTHDHGYDPHSTPKTQSIAIGKHAWIGLNAVILPSTRTIGDYAVIGAGAVVTRPVPDYAIVAGNPAKVIKIRPDAPAEVLAAFPGRAS